MCRASKVVQVMPKVINRMATEVKPAVLGVSVSMVFVLRRSRISTWVSMAGILGTLTGNKAQ